ncbi:mannose-6-phosphate isomerase, class I [Streptomyces ipomoeae]|uniref:Mannose-6-phosphate isomerase n=2 Tax=Streptomyces ipomoeae TaxID=103232 RepID=L1KKT1_9ACTN|nr:mannose-6-phosphate isomerase, class I [Streptomyces ipomoeae]EKX61174.1 mannose-6-phosphate isomerase, class I [Streptomyces ipomoeae 91-03]MDX2698781.1 mannose-6-phosphate isomerase, class I [Streptomyces ipomoeae]MDX2828002.1 mannose-6-phosphate isomerase, class I [Streptomyces ipomoeae]MDX2844454.1 mannose-6-phosphate isomerase, class I [Streptomyces ipomoeae]MDX2878047.1 mannose-6-phosphate isomerase, class I [Streptomyces ipomoeae]
MDRLDNTIRPYAWGSTTAIPNLLGVAPTGEPQAEMWMGAHPGAPSRTERGPLTEVIDEAPERELGARTVAKFGPRLPFLLKILAAGAPLSLQVHPNLEQAREGYEDEERRGIPIDAAHRNYKDANHKPELICALTEFDGLCGFRDPNQAADLLAALDVDSLKPYVDLLHAHPEEAALREVLTAVLSADPEAMGQTVTEAAAACARLGAAYAPYADIARHYPGDPGVIAAMLLNHVRLQPGEALFLGAGIPHAYLNGLGVEIMANSDNVLRCGLTPKHVDVPELLRIVRFEATDPGVLRPEASPDGEEVYETPIDEFRLSRHVLPEGATTRDLTRETPQILLCTAGTVRAGEHTLAPGQSVFVPAGEKAEVSGTGTLFRATVVA